MMFFMNNWSSKGFFQIAHMFSNQDVIFSLIIQKSFKNSPMAMFPMTPILQVISIIKKKVLRFIDNTAGLWHWYPGKSCLC